MYNHVVVVLGSSVDHIHVGAVVVGVSRLVVSCESQHNLLPLSFILDEGSIRNMIMGSRIGS